MEESKAVGPTTWEVSNHCLCVCIEHRTRPGGLRQRKAFEKFLSDEGIEADGTGFNLRFLVNTHPHDDLSANANENRLQFLKALAMLPHDYDTGLQRMLGGWYSQGGLWLLDDFGNLVSMDHQQIWAGCYHIVDSGDRA